MPTLFTVVLFFLPSPLGIWPGFTAQMCSLKEETTTTKTTRFVLLVGVVPFEFQNFQLLATRKKKKNTSMTHTGSEMICSCVSGADHKEPAAP